MGRALFHEVAGAVVPTLEAVVCDYGAGHGGSGDDGNLGEVHCWSRGLLVC
jgi:hypothetical protein